jgi:hypothetical protein
MQWFGPLSILDPTTVGWTAGIAEPLTGLPALSAACFDGQVR